EAVYRECSERRLFPCSPARGFCPNTLTLLSARSHDQSSAVDRFHVSFHIFAYSVGVLPNKFSGRNRARVLKRQPQGGHIRKHCETVFLSDKARWWIEDGAFDAL